MARGETEAEVLGGAKALYNQLVPLGRKRLEESFFDLVLAQCKQYWPDENWEDCSNMAELVRAMEDRVTTWPEKWRANYIAEGHAKGRAEGRAQERADNTHAMLVSLEKAVRARFGEVAARSFGQQFEADRQGAAAESREIMDAICQCVMLSENAEQLLAGLRSIRLEAAQQQ